MGARHAGMGTVPGAGWRCASAVHGCLGQRGPAIEASTMLDIAISSRLKRFGGR